MNEPIFPISQIAEISPTQNFAQTPTPTAGFASLFANEISAVNNGLLQTDADKKNLAMGRVSSLHEVMMRMEEAKLSFQLLVQVRNKLLESYQEVMRMQV